MSLCTGMYLVHFRCGRIMHHSCVELSTSFQQRMDAMFDESRWPVA